MAEWKTCEVDEPVNKPHIRECDGKHFTHSITVHFFDENGKEIDKDKKEYHYTTPKEVLADIHEGREINLRQCYVKDLKIGNILDDLNYTPIVVHLQIASGAFFDGDTVLHGVEFDSKDVFFDGSVFGYDKYSQNPKIVLFEHVVFYNGNVSFNGVHFLNKKDFTDVEIRNGNILFGCSLYNNCSAYFNKTSCPKGYFSFIGTIANQITVINYSHHSQTQFQFMSAQINKLVFDNIVIEGKLNLGSIINLSYIEFKNCINQGNIVVDWKKNRLAPAIEAILDDEKGTLADLHRRAAETALLLKENFRKMGRYEDEDCAYVCYKKHDLREQYYSHVPEKWYRSARFWLLSPWFLLRRLIPHLFKLVVFEWVGGYGTRPRNILVSIVAVIMLFAGLYHTSISLGRGTIKGITSAGIMDLKALAYSAYFSAVTFLTVGYGDHAPTSWLIRFLASAEGLIGLILISYFTIAFSRKVLR